ncbi:MAG TPA: hypothetical protein VEH26_03110 [Chthoniobacterales bacterium]|nr:hypothetical protein [Chthoniobacterales bacterium]
MKAKSNLAAPPDPATRQSPLVIFRWIWAVLLVVLTSAPYLINWASTPVGYHYTWILPPYPEDSFGYMSWAQQAANGAWLFKIKYTALPHAPFLFHPLFLISGWFSALFSVPIGIVFWILKAIGVTSFLIVFYRYLDYLRLNAAQSVVASVLVGLSSGFGAFFVWYGNSHLALMPADLWMPEVSTFWSLLWNPLFPFSLVLMLLSIFWLDRGTQDRHPSDLWKSGLATGVMVLLHPYSAPLLFTLAVFIAVAREKVKAAGYLLRYFAASLPFALYPAAVARLNPILAQHSVTGTMKSPSPVEYALGFGFALLLFITGFVVLRSQLLKRYWHIALWFFLSLVLAYFPFWFQRKLIFGAQIPLCIIGGIVFDVILVRWVAKPWRRWAWISAAMVLLPLSSATSWYLLVRENKEVRADQEGSYYLSDELFEGLKVLRDRTRPDQIVFALPFTSRLIPALSGNTVVWGHWAMSIDSKERQVSLAKSLGLESPLSAEERASEFWGSGIQIIFADGQLKQYIDEHRSIWGVILRDSTKIFENQSVVIYQRKNGA